MGITEQEKRLLGLAWGTRAVIGFLFADEHPGACPDGPRTGTLQDDFAAVLQRKPCDVVATDQPDELALLRQFGAG